MDILEKGGYVAECNWKEEKEEFIYSINNMNKLKSKGLMVRDEWLDEDGEITEWMETLDRKCETDKFEQLKHWAEEVGFTIAYGREM